MPAPGPSSRPMIIKSLEGVPFEAIHAASAAAFSDYVEPVSLSLSQLRYMLERRGYDPAMSFGAFVDGEIVGFTFNGLRDWQGVRTAYDCGTAVRKAFRGHGAASSLFRTFLPVLRDHGVRRYLLEVIKSNKGAVRLYEKLGFSVTREFDYWVTKPKDLRPGSAHPPTGFSFDEICTPDWSRLSQFWDFAPSWQNSIDSVMSKHAHITMLGARQQGEVVAYACLEKETGDLPQLAVHEAFRRRGLATALVRRLLADLEPPEFRVINTVAGHGPHHAFLTGLGMEPGHGQFEMALDL